MLKKTYRFRLNLLYCVPFLFILGLVPRLYVLQVLDRPFFEKLARQQHFAELHLVPSRGKIFDANGHELAASVMLKNAYIQSDRLESISDEVKAELAHDLVEVSGRSFDDILRRMHRRGKIKVAMLARNLDENGERQIRSIVANYKKNDVPSDCISFEPTGKRKYSRGDLAPQVVGFTQPDKTGDNTGAAGVELKYNSLLRGEPRSYVTRKDAAGMPMEPADPETIDSTFGDSIKLTIDENIQAITQNCLANGVDEVHADHGVAVVYKVKTGEVLAMASYPSYDINMRQGSTASQRTNRCITDAIEPGSVMKIFTFLSLFDEKKIEPTDTVFCENGTWQINPHRAIHDTHDLGVVPITEVFYDSSNIGTVKSARKLDPKTFYEHLRALGLGRKTGIDLSGESRGRLLPSEKWDKNSTMYALPMGYEIQVTAIQVAAAVGAIANQGRYMQPHVVKQILDHNGNVVENIKPTFVRQVADPVACRKILNMMELVVQKGTGKAAKVEGYRVGGKTGTTKKVINGAYSSKNYIAAFCGVAPLEDPEVCIYVYVDNPVGAKRFGGQVSAPIFSKVAAECMKRLHVPMTDGKTAQTPDFGVVLDSVRNRIQGRLPTDIFHRSPEVEEPATGSMPDVMRMSLREAITRLADHNLKISKIIGSGIVIAQNPKKWVTLEKGQTVELILGSEKQYAEEQLRQMGQLDETSSQTAPVGIPGLDLSRISLSSENKTIDLPVEKAGHPSWLHSSRFIPVSPQLPVVKEPSYPDLDTIANQAPDPKAGRQAWKDFEKTMEAEKKASSRPTHSKAGQDNINEGEMTPALTDQLPVFDGTEEVDPDSPDAAPIEISTKRNVSLYDLQGKK